MKFEPSLFVNTPAPFLMLMFLLLLTAPLCSSLSFFGYWVPGLSHLDPTKSHHGKCAKVGISIQRRVSGIRFVTPESSFCSAPTGFPQLGWCYMDCHFMECFVQSLRFCVCCVLLLLVGIGVLSGCIVQFLRFCVCGVSLDWLEACVFDGKSRAMSCPAAVG